MTAYVEFDNGKKYSAKDVADIVIRLRKTSSAAEIIYILQKEYKFTLNDVFRFQDMMKTLMKYWDGI